MKEAVAIAWPSPWITSMHSPVSTFHALAALSSELVASRRREIDRALGHPQPLLRVMLAGLLKMARRAAEPGPSTVGIVRSPMSAYPQIIAEPYISVF